MTTKFLIIGRTFSGQTVLDMFSVEATARKMLPNYKAEGINSLYIKQVSVH